MAPSDEEEVLQERKTHRGRGRGRRGCGRGRGQGKGRGQGQVRPKFVDINLPRSPAISVPFTEDW